MVMCVSLVFFYGFSKTITAVVLVNRSVGLRAGCAWNKKKKEFFAYVFEKYKIISNICINGPARAK